MELKNDFRVGVSLSEAWKVLTDVERIAPMLPGAQLQEIEGDEYRGIVKVKVGPITAQYKGVATFVETDEAVGKMVLRAAGRDTRGQGNATATITAVMTADGDATKVEVTTDLTVTGKVAQFGRGVLADVSAKLIGQFVDALEGDLASSSTTGDVKTDPASAGTPGGNVTNVPPVLGPSDLSPGTPTASAGPRRIDAPEPLPVDLLGVAGGTVAKRLLPVAGVVAAAMVLLLLCRARARRSRG